jgi:hypothetical protein
MKKTIIFSLSILFFSNSTLAQQVNHISNSSITSAITASVQKNTSTHSYNTVAAKPYSAKDHMNSSLYGSALAIQEEHTKFMKHSNNNASHQHPLHNSPSPSFFNRVLEINGS